MGDSGSMRTGQDVPGGHGSGRNGPRLILPPPGASEKPWPAPERLATIPWPIHTLPAWIADHCANVAQRVQVPVDLCAQQALACLATAVMGKIALRITATWTEPLSLYLVTVMGSGAGKSPADKHITGVLVILERNLVLAQRPAFLVAQLKNAKAVGVHAILLK